MSNTGRFEPPGSQAVSAFVTLYDRELDPRWRALRAAEERAAAHAAQILTIPAPVKHKGPKCSICRSYVSITINPWQRTRTDILAADISDDSDSEFDEKGPVAETSAAGAVRTQKKVEKHGLELKPCKHVFCGACLAQSIYRNLNVPFEPLTYGTKLHPTELAPFSKKMEFPMGCPSCQVKPGEQMNEISDMSARLVLGDANMDEWNHARFMLTLDIIHCPHKGCGEPFDANDVAPAQFKGPYASGLVQCPKCQKTLCKDCRAVWHEKLSCKEFQALPVTDRAPEDIAFVELAKQKKWRRCPKCKAMVELKYGCNHIACTCKHHFCYTCGADFEHKNGKYRCTSGKGCKIWEENALLERQ